MSRTLQYVKQHNQAALLWAIAVAVSLIVAYPMMLRYCAAAQCIDLSDATMALPINARPVAYVISLLAFAFVAAIAAMIVVIVSAAIEISRNPVVQTVDAQHYCEHDSDDHLRHGSFLEVGRQMILSFVAVMGFFSLGIYLNVVF